MFCLPERALHHLVDRPVARTEPAFAEAHRRVVYELRALVAEQFSVAAVRRDESFAHVASRERAASDGRDASGPAAVPLLSFVPNLPVVPVVTIRLPEFPPTPPGPLSHLLFRLATLSDESGDTQGAAFTLHEVPSPGTSDSSGFRVWCIAAVRPAWFTHSPMLSAERPPKAAGLSARCSRECQG